MENTCSKYISLLLSKCFLRIIDVCYYRELDKFIKRVRTINELLTVPETTSGTRLPSMIERVTTLPYHPQNSNNPLSYHPQNSYNHDFEIQLNFFMEHKLNALHYIVRIYKAIGYKKNLQKL